MFDKKVLKSIGNWMLLALLLLLPCLLMGCSSNDIYLSTSTGTNTTTYINITNNITLTNNITNNITTYINSTINGSIIPPLDGVYVLGNSSNEWNQTWSHNAYIDYLEVHNSLLINLSTSNTPLNIFGNNTSFIQILIQNRNRFGSSDLMTGNDLSDGSSTFMNDIGITGSNFSDSNYINVTPANTSYHFFTNSNFVLSGGTSGKIIKVYLDSFSNPTYIMNWTNNSIQIEAKINITGNPSNNFLVGFNLSLANSPNVSSAIGFLPAINGGSCATSCSGNGQNVLSNIPTINNPTMTGNWSMTGGYIKINSSIVAYSACSLALDGQLRYNVTNHQMMYCNSTVWKQI